VLLVHGLGGHSNNWEYLSEYLQEKDITSYGIELKGFGATEDLKGHIDSLNTYIKDVRRLNNIIKRRHKGKKVFLIGESMGGIIAFMTAIKKPDLFDGIVCISPGFWSLLKFSFPDYVKMISARFYKPDKQFRMPFDSRICTRDPEMQKMIDADPLEHRFATPKLLQSILLAQIYSRFFKHKISTDILFQVAGNDEFVDTPTSIKIFEGLRARNKKLIEYDEMKHSLVAEIGKEKVFEDTLQWVRERL